jgi:hypothetical protein
VKRPRQPLKLVDLQYPCELTRIHRTDVGQERAATHAGDDFIRTNSHTTPATVRARMIGHWMSFSPGARVGSFEAKYASAVLPDQVIISELQGFGQVFRTDVSDAACATNPAKNRSVYRWKSDG